jgi:hypothetical protein
VCRKKHAQSHIFQGEQLSHVGTIIRSAQLPTNGFSGRIIVARCAQQLTLAKCQRSHLEKDQGVSAEETSKRSSRFRGGTSSEETASGNSSIGRSPLKIS